MQRENSMSLQLLTEMTHRLTEKDKHLRVLSSAIQSSPVMVVITDKDGIIEYVNPQFTAVTGYTENEVRGNNPSVLKSGEMSSDVYLELWKTISTGKEWRGELLNRKKNGDLYWVRISISGVRDDVGSSITHYVAISEDITKEMDMKRRLHEEKQMLEITLRSIGDGVIATDIDGRVTMMNVAAEHILGWSSADAIGMPFDIVFRAIDRHTEKPIPDPIRKAIDSGNVIYIPDTSMLIKKNGETVPISDSAAPIFGPSGKCLGAVVSFRVNFSQPVEFNKE